MQPERRDEVLLIVDDDDAFRRSTSRALDRHGYRCLEAPSGDAARTRLRANESVAAVLCDIRMPGMSGTELLEELTADHPGVAVIMTTGIDDPAVADAAFASGALGYLVKPFEVNELLIVLTGALRRRDQDAVHRRKVSDLERMITQAATNGGTVHSSRASAAPAVPDRGERETPIRVLVVDDHEIFTQSLVRLLEGRPDIDVVATSGSVESALSAVVELDPDVVLMDFHLPDGDGATATSRIKALAPRVKVVMLTARSDEQALALAIGAGCSGFVRKDEAVEALYRAVVAAHEDELVIPPGELAPLLRRLPPTKGKIGADLTRRELEVLGLVVKGLANKEIAQELGLRLNTVRNHVQNVLYKLQAHSKLEAVAAAVRENVIAYPVS